MSWWTNQQLRIGSPKTRLAVVEKLSLEYDADAVGPLIFALRDKIPDVRCLAARALLRYNDPKAVDPLIDHFARPGAPRARRRCGNPWPARRRQGDCATRRPLARCGPDRSGHRRAKFKPPRLETRFRAGPRACKFWRWATSRNWWRWDPKASAHLLETLRNGTPNKQYAAVKALGQVNDSRVLPAMLEALKKNSPRSARRRPWRSRKPGRSPNFSRNRAAAA